MKKIAIILIGILSTPVYADMQQAISAFEQHEFDLAKNILQKESNDNFVKFHYLALIASSNEQLNKAEKHIEQALALNSKNAELHFSYAAIMAKQAEDASIFSLRGYLKKVKHAFIKAVELKPNNTEYRRALINFHVNAPSMLGGEISEALRHAKTLKSIDALLGSISLIKVHKAMSADKELNDELQATVQSFANDPELYYQLGLFYQEQEDYSDAFASFRRAASMPASTNRQRKAKDSASFQIGLTSIRSSNNLQEGKQALQHYLKNAVITPSMPSRIQAKYRLANVVEELGEAVQASKLYTKLSQQAMPKKLQDKINKRLKKLD